MKQPINLREELKKMNLNRDEIEKALDQLLKGSGRK